MAWDPRPVAQDPAHPTPAELRQQDRLLTRVFLGLQLCIITSVAVTGVWELLVIDAAVLLYVWLSA